MNPDDAPREPETKRIYYQDGYRYQLTDSYRHQLGFTPPAATLDKWIQLDADGTLIIRHGYAWDGPSGPTIDTPCFMRGPLVHDAGYQLLREGLLPPEYRAHFDDHMLVVILEDILATYGAQPGDGWWTKFQKASTAQALSARAQAWHAAVRLAAGPAASPESLKEPLSAP